MSDPAASSGRAHTPAAIGAGGEGVVLRCLSSQEDYEACVELQRRTWGRRFGEVVPPSVLKVSRRVGGVAVGAFDAGGRLLGFVWGLSGVRPRGPEGSSGPGSPGSSSGPGGPGEPSDPGGSPGLRPQIVHWSHMLAVDPEGRDRGLGTRLKLHQRELLLALGVEVVEWTYDPLEARNAHLNFNHLGCEAAEYVQDMYRGERGSELWRGIGTDRFVVSWRIGSPRVAATLAGGPREAARTAEASFAAAPVAGEAADRLPQAPRVRVEIPPDVQALRTAQPGQARAWRRRTRLAFTTYMGRGWQVEAFYRDPANGRCFYGLRREEGPPCASSGSL